MFEKFSSMSGINKSSLYQTININIKNLFIDFIDRYIIPL